MAVMSLLTFLIMADGELGLKVGTRCLCLDEIVVIETDRTVFHKDHIYKSALDGTLLGEDGLNYEYDKEKNYDKFVSSFIKLTD